MNFVDVKNMRPICRLYKYYSNINHSIDVITNKRIHFEKPSTYNDIFDSTIAINDDILKRGNNTVENIYKDMKRLLPIDYHETIDKFKNNFNENKIISYKEFVEYVLKNRPNTSQDYLLQKIFNSRTFVYPDNYFVSCFSEKRDSLLMWSYYANKHSGVCLGFDIASDPILRDHCYKVMYSDFFSPGLINNNFVFLKSSQWAHEQEWRIVQEGELFQDKTVFNEYIYTDSLAEIILGVRVNEEDKNKIINSLIHNKKSITCFQACASTEKYELNFKKCNI